MIKLLEKLGDRMLGTVVPSITAEATSCYGIPIGSCRWICCNQTCTVAKLCCLLQYTGICKCDPCIHT